MQSNYVREGHTILPDIFKYHLEAGCSKWQQKQL